MPGKGSLILQQRKRGVGKIDRKKGVNVLGRFSPNTVGRKAGEVEVEVKNGGGRKKVRKATLQRRLTTMIAHGTNKGTKDI